MIQFNSHECIQCPWVVALGIFNQLTSKSLVLWGCGITVRYGFLTLGAYNLNCCNKADSLEIEKIIRQYTKEVWCIEVVR